MVDIILWKKTVRCLSIASLSGGLVIIVRNIANMRVHNFIDKIY